MSKNKTQINKRQKDIEKEILSGKYRDGYLIYNRKSTDEADSQKNSLEYQKFENSKFAKKEKLPIAPVDIKGFCHNGIISEKQSGYKQDEDINFTEEGLVQYRIDRPKFQRLTYFLSKKFFKGVICLCWDRISRNKADDTLIRKLIKNGCDFRFVQAKYEKSSSGALHMDIDGMFAEHYSRVTSEKIKLTTQKMRADGICTYRAPIGYLNEGNSENKPVDPVRGPFVKKLFEYYTTGEWSVADLARWANEHGMTTVPMRRRRTEGEILENEETDVESKIEKVTRPITATLVQKILRNKFYTGKTLNSDGVYIPSKSHKAIISEELFNKVQKGLSKKNVSLRYTNKLELPYRGVARCSECGRAYTPYVQKGIQYYGSRCIKGCKNSKKNFNGNFLEEKIVDFMSMLKLRDEEKNNLNIVTSEDVSLFEEKRIKNIEEGEGRKKRIREKLSYLRTNKLSLLMTGAYSPKTFMEEEDNLNAEILEIQNEEISSDVSMGEVIRDVVILSELIKDGLFFYLNANLQEKELIARTIFSELFISDSSLIFKCKNGFQFLETRFASIYGPTGSRTPTSSMPWMRSTAIL